MSGHTVAAALSASVAATLSVANIKNHVPVTLSFKAGNYSRWSTYIRAACGKFEVLDHIDGSPDRPNKMLWEQDHTVRTWLFTSVTDDVLDVSIEDEQCAYEL